MKHNDETSPNDTSARLDALLSDFLSKDITEPIDSSASPQATSKPLGERFIDDSVAETELQIDSPTSPAPQKIVPTNRTDVWEATSQPARLSESDSSSLITPALDPLEKKVNSIVSDPALSPGGKRFFLAGSVSVILLLVAVLLIWRGWRIEAPQTASEEPTLLVPPHEVDAPSSIEASTGATDNTEVHPGRFEVDAANSSVASSDPRRPGVAVLVPDSSAITANPPTVKDVSQSTASNASKLQRLPTPTIGSSNLTLGTIQGLPSLQSDLPPTPLPLPPGVPPRPAMNDLTDSTGSTNATSAVPLAKVKPVYPELARRMNVSGTVHEAIVVYTAGKVISAKAFDGPPALRGSAAAAVKQWRFTPSTMNGNAVNGTGTVSVVFKTGAE